MVTSSAAQDLSEHQWEDRLILVLTTDTTNSVFKEQLRELYSDPKGLEDRRLVIYKVLPDQYLRDDRADESWQESPNLYKEFKKSDEPFEVILIGLDGGIKLRKSELLTNEQLFERIDQMPMRKAELKNRQG